MPQRLQAISDRIASLLREYRDDDDDVPTEVYREVAALVIEARTLFVTRAGDPDWRGLTYAYRAWNGETMRAAGLSEAKARRAAATIRYHVGNQLRELLDDETLEDAGLQHESPRERGAELRLSRADTVRLFSPGAPIDDPVDVSHALAAMTTTLRRLDLDVARRAPEWPAYVAEVGRQC